MAIVIGIWLAVGSPASAAGTTQPGLGITPLRKDLSVQAGTPKADLITIANYTGQPITVDLAANEFSVTDYSYDYEFKAPPKNDWIVLPEKTITLKAGESRKVLYDVNTPKKAAPGGYYFSLVASTTVTSGSIPTTLRATTLLYLTVKGELIRTSVLNNSSIPWFIMDGRIPYKFDVTDTGNVHFGAYFFGRLDGLFGSFNESGATHLLLPGATRTVQNTIESPLLPGIYKATYGYAPDFANFEITKSSYIVYLPLWSIFAGILIALFAMWALQRRKRHKS